MSIYAVRFNPDALGSWDLYRDGERVSQHATHDAAVAALNALPPRATCVICGEGFEADPSNKHRHATGELVHMTCFARLDAA